MNPPPVPRYRYFIFVLVMLMALLNYVDRGAISYAASSITHEYGFDKGAWLTFRTSRTQFGANFVASPAGERRLPGRRVA
jgi:hypothetical protein